MEIMRKLASVRTISDISPIENADNIVCATVDGWKVVTQKSNNFKPGDLVVYFEIDSFLPVTEKFEFLRKSSFKVMEGKEGFRLKTIRLRGQISQGLILPMSEFFTLNENGFWTTPGGIVLEDGDDLTEYLGVLKYEKALASSLSGIAKGNFPSFIQKTDQERVQNIYKYFFRDEWSYIEFETTLKLDGSSMTVYYKDGYVGVCSRNLDLLEDDTNSFWKMAKDSNLINSLAAYGKNFAIQGELMGPGIQGNREKFDSLKFFVFDVFDIDKFEYLDPFDRDDVLIDLRDCGAKIDQVPRTKPCGYAMLSDYKSLDDMLAYAERPSINASVAEGVVFKSMKGPRKSFKIISNKFLMGEKD